MHFPFPFPIWQVRCVPAKLYTLHLKETVLSASESYEAVFTVITDKWIKILLKEVKEMAYL